MNSKEVSKIAGISVRTLHYYDEMGLLKPNRNNENNYREYTYEDIAILQQILFFKECGFSLENIAELLQSPAFDREEAFELQRKALLYEKRRIETMLQTIEKSLKELKGEITMNTNEKFEGFNFDENPYEEEARKLWGEESVNKSNKYINSLGKEGKDKMKERFDELFTNLSKLVGSDPYGEDAQAAMAEMYRYFNSNFGIEYTPEGFAGLGKMYVEDPRFTKNIDKYAEGLSLFLSKAMAYFAEHIAD